MGTIMSRKIGREGGQKRALRIVSGPCPFAPVTEVDIKQSVVALFVEFFLWGKLERRGFWAF